jgi:hypothetical protein
MKRDDLVKHFGSVAQTARAFGISVSAVYQWGEVVPERIAYKAQILTGGVVEGNQTWDFEAGEDHGFVASSCGAGAHMGVAGVAATEAFESRGC